MKLPFLNFIMAWFLVGFAFIPFAFAADSDDPATELASFQVADGFVVNLFASEKDGVLKPIQMRFDTRGRLWLIGSTVYPQIEPGVAPDDKVLILEDTDGDGRADKTTVFAGGLKIPTGIELGDGGAYIGHGSELLFLKDTDGDDKADERRVVLRGFGTGDNHQNINSFLWGPGGEMWMSQGLHIESSVETPWGIVRLNQAGIWRWRPRLLKLEGFYGSQHEPQNPWGFVFTDWGEPIVLAGNNSSPIYPVPGLVSSRRIAPPSLIWKNGNGRKVSGGDIVGTAHFPDAWQGALILGGYLNNALWAVKIKDDGAGLVLEDLPPLLKSTSTSFRPVDVKFGPDGALYICDWYNPIIGHYQASFRHPDRDKTHGRIWRISAKGRPLAKPPRLAGVSMAELLTLLKSDDRWTRQFAKRALADSPADTVISALENWTTKPGLSARDLKEALGVFQSHEMVSLPLLEKLCVATNAGARAYAAGVVGAWADRLPGALQLLRKLVADENARVRLQAVVACSYVPTSEAMEVAAIAADFPVDKFLSYALNQTVFALKPYWLPAFAAGKLNLGNSAARLELLVGSDGTTDTLPALRELVKSPGIDSATREMYLRTLADLGDANDLANLLKLAGTPSELRAIASSVRVRQVRPSGDLESALRLFIEGGDTELSAEALKLAGWWKVEGFRSRAESIAQDSKADAGLRRDAIEALAFFGGGTNRELFSRLARDENPAVQSAALVALTEFDLDQAAQLAGEAFAVLADEAALVKIFSAFLQREGGMATLEKVLSAKAPTRAAAEIGLRVMNASGRRNDSLARVLAAAAGMTVGSFRMNPSEVATFVEDVRTHGNVKRGEQIYRRPELGCVACHVVDGEGGGIGPNLSALGTAQPVDFIIGAILDPQKEVKEGYTSISLTTVDGEELEGYLVRETKDEIVIRDVLRNQEVRLRSSAVKEKKQHGSVMPAGLADTLTRPEFRDLIRYLSRLGKAAD